jgi:hypothetical protein
MQWYNSNYIIIVEYEWKLSNISDIIKGKFKLSKYLNRFTLCTFQKKNLINKYQNKYILDFSTVLHPDRHSTDLDRHGRDCIDSNHVFQYLSK